MKVKRSFLSNEKDLKLVRLSVSYLIPRNCGFSPGAAVSDSLVSDLTWLMERTVAATNQGRPKMEHSTINSVTINKSKW